VSMVAISIYMQGAAATTIHALRRTVRCLPCACLSNLLCFNSRSSSAVVLLNQPQIAGKLQASPAALKALNH
jgi:hypothetical protein